MSAQAEYSAALHAFAARSDAAIRVALGGAGDAPSVATIVDAVAPVVDSLGDVSAALAADYYDSARAEAGASGAFTADLAASPSEVRVAGIAGWGLREGADADGRLELIRGALARAVAGSGRDTVRLSVARDRVAHGWRRVTRPGGCDFCRMLAGRGEVYGKDTARFGSHDHCGCFAAPAFAQGMSVTVNQHLATKRIVTDADRARLREYLAHS